MFYKRNGYKQTQNIFTIFCHFIIFFHLNTEMNAVARAQLTFQMLS